MKISQKEIKSILKLDAFERYRHFIKRVSDTEEIYTLTNERGDYALSEVENHILFSLWPFEEYAELCRTCDWKNYNVVKLDIDAFNNKIIPLIRKENYLVNVFAADEKSGFIVSLEEFTRDLAEELRHYE